jgi:hypothetical protein
LRPLAFTLAVFWSLQVLVCLPPAAGDEHAQDHAAPREANAGGEHGPHSHAPGPNHHEDSDSDGGCAQHCASLSQTVAASPATVPVPNLSWVAIVPVPAVGDLPRVLIGALARLELGRPPPDLLARNATLRI